MPLDREKLNPSGDLLEMSLEELVTDLSEIIHCFHDSPKFEITKGANPMNQEDQVVNFQWLSRWDLEAICSSLHYTWTELIFRDTPPLIRTRLLTEVDKGMRTLENHSLSSWKLQSLLPSVGPAGQFVLLLKKKINHEFMVYIKPSDLNGLRHLKKNSSLLPLLWL